MCRAAAFAAAFAFSLEATVLASEKFPRESGDWASIEWEPTGVPIKGDEVTIGDDLSVRYTGAVSPDFSRLFVGADAGGGSTTGGALEIVNGEIRVHANSVSAIQIGLGEGSSGSLTIDGGTLTGFGISTGAGLQVATGENSTGSLTIKSGALELGNGLYVGWGDGSTGRVTVEGGVVTISSNGESGSFLVGSRIPDGVFSTATYRQTGGVVTVAHNYLGVGYSGSTRQVMTSVAEILGGSLTANVRIGRERRIQSGAGTAEMIIDSSAEVTGMDAPWQISGNGQLIFVLGEDDNFNAVDLRSVKAGPAIELTQEGAQIMVDGSQYKPGIGQRSIELIKYSEGSRPALMSEQNGRFGFEGFALGAKPELVWTETALVLNL